MAAVETDGNETAGVGAAGDLHKHGWPGVEVNDLRHDHD